MATPPGFTDKDWFKKNKENGREIPVFYLPPPPPPSRYSLLKFQIDWKPPLKSVFFPRVQ